MFNKEEYANRRKLGARGQQGISFRPGMGLIMGQKTSMEIEKTSGPVGSRKERRKTEAHGQGRKRREEAANKRKGH